MVQIIKLSFAFFHFALKPSLLKFQSLCSNMDWLFSDFLYSCHPESFVRRCPEVKPHFLGDVLSFILFFSHAVLMGTHPPVVS